MKLNTEFNKIVQIDKQSKKIDRKSRKKEWSTTKRYCVDCFYSLTDEEVDRHEDCFKASREKGRTTHPQMMKILKESRRK